MAKPSFYLINTLYSIMVRKINIIGEANQFFTSQMFQIPHRFLKTIKIEISIN